MKYRIKLTESSLRNIVKESVKKVLKENTFFQRPVDGFHPDWWYYRQDVKPDYLDYDDPFDDDLDDEKIKENKPHKTIRNMKHRINLTEQDLQKVIKESVKRALRENRHPLKRINEAESSGWVVEDDDAWEAYEFACERLGKDKLDTEIINALSTSELAECLVYIFRMYDFRDWDEYKQNGDDDVDEY